MPVHITFENQQEAYFPGQEVEGVLNINISSEKQVSSIVICVCGVGVLQRDGDNEKEVKQELYFDQVSTVFSCKGEDNVKYKLEIGPKTFPFKFLLPQKIPASFESPNGYVRYTVTAYVEESDGRLQTALAIFTVNGILDLNRIPKSRVPCTDWAQQDVCLFCFKCGPMSAVLNIPRRGFVPGECILINAEINNLQNKAISFVKATLVQVIKYNHKTGPKKIKRAVAEVLRGSVMPYESQVWREEPLQIPPVPASRLAHCTLMDIWYNLYMHVCFTGLQLGETVKLLKVPIIIGTVPLQQQMEQFELGTGEPLIPGTTLSQPNTEPCVFGPYSITEINSDGSLCELTFTPLYVTYTNKRETRGENNMVTVVDNGTHFVSKTIESSSNSIFTSTVL